MKYLLLMLLCLSCANGNKNQTDINHDASEKQIFSDQDGCTYFASEEVALEFIRRVPEKDRFLVDFWVVGKNEKFEYGGKMSEECSEDFQKKGSVNATLQKIKTGSCNRIVIFPKEYEPGCFNL